jgi:hypothetical protein
MCWQWVYPDCRAIGFNGGGLLDWQQVAVVLRDFHGVGLSGTLHRKLRTCQYEMLTIEAEGREVKANGRESNNQL